MKTVVLAFLCLCVTSAVAEVERSLKKSPDGRFEVILTAEDDKDLGRVSVRDLRSGKEFETESGQGYGSFINENVKVEWKSDSDAFAVSYRGTKSAYLTDVYVRGDEVWEKLDEPPYVANILGRQGVLKLGRRFRQSFQVFMEDSKFSILCYIEPDGPQKEAAKLGKWKPSNETEWRVVLQYHLGERPNCRMVSIEEALEPEAAEKAAMQTE